MQVRGGVLEQVKKEQEEKKQLAMMRCLWELGETVGGVRDEVVVGWVEASEGAWDKLVARVQAARGEEPEVEGRAKVVEAETGGTEE